MTINNKQPAQPPDKPKATIEELNRWIAALDELEAKAAQMPEISEIKRYLTSIINRREAVAAKMRGNENAAGNKGGGAPKGNKNAARKP